MRDHHIDLCGQIDFTRTEAMPLLARDAHFSFACNGCGDCCRGREDIVLSGFDLWRIAARLRLPPQIVARGYCRASIGTVSHLPVLRPGPGEGEPEQLSLPYGRPLRHPRCRTAGVCSVPAGAGDQQERTGELFSAAHRLRRADDRGKGGGLSCSLRCPGPGTDRCALGADLHDTGRHGGTAGCAAQPGAGAPDAGQAPGRRCILATTMPHRSCRSWRKTCTGWMLNLQNWQNISKNGITHQNNRSIYLIQSIIKAVLGQK